ncbi:PR domain zinc finger protein 2 [Mastacembelus armatus]|uniref:PR domain zinc finger protein 2 n=1 Tax=Mastacembelus armatus TaxID=205130 RepID=UPI000E464045|nr:PR domain zinc finger protein 2-like [Mastacembelus armatus]
MEDSSHLYVTEAGENEDIEANEDIYHDETKTEPEMVESLSPDLHRHPKQGPERHWDSFPCQHCEKCFTSRQGVEQHMHTHALEDNEAHSYKSNKSDPCFDTNVGQLQHEKLETADMQLQTSSSTGSNSSILSGGDCSVQADKHRALDDHQAHSKCCEKIFTTYTNKQQHECRIHRQHLQLMCAEKTQQEENLQRIFGETSQQETQRGDSIAPAAVLENEGKHTEQYMLDIPSNISENLSFYIDGKIVSTSTVSSCEAAEVHSGSSTLVGLDALILDPTQISQVLNTDSITCKEVPGQPPAKRRTATPPLLPQIKTELESEVVASSCSSSLVSSLIENLLPQSTESSVVQKERTVFLSPKLKQLLEKQDGLKPTLALIADGQKPCSPVSLSVLPAGSGRFKRRTGSPTSSPQQNPTSEETATPDMGDFDPEGTGQIETPHVSPVHPTPDESDRTPSLEEPAVLTETWPPMTGGNSCNQQPLDLSNAVKRNEDVALADSVLDLSLQKKSPDASELTLNLVSQTVLKEGNSSRCMMEKVIVNTGEQSVSLRDSDTPLVTDFAIVTSSDMVTPVETVTEGLVYGLALPPNSLTPSPASLTPVALQPASPCTIAFASPVSHTMLPTAPSLITVLAPPPVSDPTNQPIQVLGPNLSPKPLVICTENALNSSECDLTTAFATADSTNLVTLSQPLDQTLNLPGHVFLTDQIALNPSMVDSAPASDIPFTSTVALNDSLINSYNITSNTVLIECTIALEAPGSGVPAAVTLQENPAEPPAPAQMVVNHIEQQQIVSVPNPQAVDPTILVSSIAESVTLSTTTSVLSDCPDAGETSPAPEPAKAEPLTTKEKEAADGYVSINNTPADALQQSFTKNFICNVCDKLFHSMKELGHHVGDHADEWPYKCEFCVLLFGKPSALLDHRTSLHGVGKTYVCSACTKEFVYLCNLKQHQEELHPGQQCTYTEEEKGKLRPQNYNNLSKVNMEPSVADAPEEPKKVVTKEEGEVDMATEELFTTIKVMASDGGKVKGPDVRLGINQHYPSFKPPPFPYHNRSPAGSMASATNFTTHNIPQTFSTAIRCTKCGKSFDNMPELHKHILACANASDKRRYTPKKNPIPLRHFAKAQNGVLSTNRLNGSNRASQSNKSRPGQESPVKLKFKVMTKRKKKLGHRVMPQRNKSVSSSHKVPSAQADEQHDIFVCPHCNREFTMRRSRTKHMAVCPKKLKEVKKRKEGGISVTKENHGHLHRGVSHVDEKQQDSPQHKTRLQTSGPTKRPSILPVQTVFANKRSKIIIKESMQPKQETPTLSELPIVRTFNPAMRQYSRVPHNVKGIPIKITIVKPQQIVPQKDELPPSQSCEEAMGAATSSSEQSATA